MKKIFIALIITMILFIIMSSISFSIENASGVWEDHSVTLSFKYRDISVNDNGTYIVVGDEGKILYSTDTLNWSNANSNTREILFGCAWGNDLYVAVGGDGSIIRSNDGIQWDRSYTNEDIRFNDVVYGDSGFVAIGTDYTVGGLNSSRYRYYSMDGIKWTKALLYKGYFSWDKVSYQNNTYIAHNAILSDEIAYSKNGIDWTVIEDTVLTSNSGLIWDGSKYISVGTDLITEDSDNSYTKVPVIYTSTNLVEWVKIDHNIKDNVSMRDIVLYKNYYYLTCSVDAGYFILRSSDLKKWEVYTKQPISNLSGSVIYNDMITFVGWNGTVVNITKNGWESTSSYNSNITKIVSDGKSFIASGHDGRFYRSEDCETWTRYSSGIDYLVADMVWAGNKYIALRQVYDSSKQTFTGVQLYSSIDGLKWTYESKIDNKNLMSLHCCNGKLFLLGQEGEIYWSTDAKTWVEADKPTDIWLKDIDWFNNQYFAVGIYGTLLKSTDGIKWEIGKLGSGNDLNSIVTNGKSMLVVGDLGGAYITTEGINWTFPQVFSTENYEKALWDGNQYVIFSYNGRYYKTKDGKNFIKYTTDLYSDVSAVSWNGEKYIVAGLYGSIATQVPNDFIKVIIDGNPVIFDVAPQLINNRTMVPARAVFEKIGASVSWDKSENRVLVVKDDITIELKVGLSFAIVNGVEKPLDSPVIIIGGRTLVPARFIAEEMGMTVNYDKKSMTVIIE